MSKVITTLLIIGVILLAVIAGVFIYQAYSEEGFGTIEKIMPKKEEIEPERVIFNCAQDASCLKEKYSKCEPAKASVSLGFRDQVLGVVTYEYEIIRSKKGFCEIKSQFTENPNSNLIGKQMICKYNNTNEFEREVENVLANIINRCEGPLVDLLAPEEKWREVPVLGEPDFDALELDLILSKSSYEVGEEIEGEWQMKYDGMPFKGLVLYRQVANDYEETYEYEGDTMVVAEDTYYTITGPAVIDDINFSAGKDGMGLKIQLDALGGVKDFMFAGNYEYSIAVYDCNTLERELNENCDSSHVGEGDYIWMNITPLKRATKSVVVSKPGEVGVIDCGVVIVDHVHNITSHYGFIGQCFVDSGEDCSPAKVITNLTIDLDIFGAISHGTQLREIRGLDENGKCIYSFTQLESFIHYKDEMVQFLNESGMTLEEIEQQEQEQNDISASIIGENNVCKFETNDLHSLLINWNAGSLSTSDWDLGECEGLYFEVYTL